MKRYVILSLTLLCCAVQGSAWAQAPHRIAGIVLGANIKDHRDIIQQDSVLPVRHMAYLSEVQVNVPEGYKSGYILYGNCAEPGRIVKIKLKYIYSAREFFDHLLKLFRKKFGEPVEYKGDAFGAFLAWKWSFTDKDRNRVSMILQHYHGEDEEHTGGNSLKMTMTTLLDKERQCYDAMLQKEGKSEGESREYQEMPQKGVNLQQFLPD